MTEKPMPGNRHNRKCHECGNIAEHEDRITPWVLCSKCGSQDTRAVKEAPNPGTGVNVVLRRSEKRDGFELIPQSVHALWKKVLKDNGDIEIKWIASDTSTKELMLHCFACGIRAAEIVDFTLARERFQRTS
jgi:ribosomal protein S27AE